MLALVWWVSLLRCVCVLGDLGGRLGWVKECLQQCVEGACRSEPAARTPLPFIHLATHPTPSYPHPHAPQSKEAERAERKRSRTRSAGGGESGSDSERREKKKKHKKEKKR